MSSSSTPDGPEPVPHLDLEPDIEADEQEVEAEHERALGVAAGRAEGAGPRLGHARLGAPRASSGSPST